MPRRDRRRQEVPHPDGYRDPRRCPAFPQLGSHAGSREGRFRASVPRICATTGTVAHDRRTARERGHHPGVASYSSPPGPRALRRRGGHLVLPLPPPLGRARHRASRPALDGSPQSLSVPGDLEVGEVELRAFSSRLIDSIQVQFFRRPDHPQFRERPELGPTTLSGVLTPAPGELTGFVRPDEPSHVSDPAPGCEGRRSRPDGDLSRHVARAPCTQEHLGSSKTRSRRRGRPQTRPSTRSTSPT